MKKITILIVMLALLAPSIVYAWTSSSFSVSIGGGHYNTNHYVGMSYSTVRVHHRRYSTVRPIIHPVIHPVIQPVPYTIYPPVFHVHRQAGRRYVNDYPCVPVVVVPVGSSTYYY
jgi:hypothetical protein